MGPVPLYQVAGALYEAWVGLGTRETFRSWEGDHPRLYDAWVDAGPGLRSLGIDAASLSDPGGRRSHPELLDVVAGVIASGTEAGELRTDLPRPLAAHIVVFHLAATTVWWMAHPHLDLRQLLDAALAHCLQGFAATRDE